MTALRRVAPGAGSYLSECDFALADWQAACWGEHAARLGSIKRRYDPADLFIVHHGVGSERWTADRFTRLQADRTRRRTSARSGRCGRT